MPHFPPLCDLTYESLPDDLWEDASRHTLAKELLEHYFETFGIQVSPRPDEVRSVYLVIAAHHVAKVCKLPGTDPTRLREVVAGILNPYRHARAA